MHWFLIALIGPFLYACVNHTDKYLISRYVAGGKVGSLIIFSSLFGVVALPIVLLFHPQVFSVSLLTASILTVNGMLIVFATLLYFYALQNDEASLVVPFYQTIPIFAFILGYFLLDETIQLGQGIASLVILAGALVLSFEFTGKAPRFKSSVVVLILGASLLYAINGVVFKLITLDTGFWVSLFWGFIGKVLLGVLFFTFVRGYRNQFLSTIRENKFIVFGLNSLSEFIFIVAESVTQYATLLAPVALVLLVNAFQPLFVFTLGVFLTLFFPKISKEKLDKRTLVQKIVGMTLIIAGSYFLGA